MTIQQWRYVLAVIDNGGFSRAAEACFVSQPTLSSQIAKLEAELGIPLFDRLSRPVRPSPAAEPLIERARTAVLSLAALPAIAADTGDRMSGTVRIGIIPTLSQYLLPLFLRGFLDAHPDLHLQITEAQSAAILTGIRRFELDYGILAPPVDPRGLKQRTLFFEEFLVYLPPGVRQPKKIEITGLETSEMLLLAEGHCLRDQIVDLCGLKTEREKSRVEFETGSLESLIALVDQRLGYTLLPELAAATLTSEQQQRLRTISPAGPVREIAMVFHPALVRPAVLEQTATAINDALPRKVRENTATSRVPWRPDHHRPRPDDFEG
ncbi:MAG: hydrogen peroxide-inducible genes activator [Spirochaetota bacterium]